MPLRLRDVTPEDKKLIFDWRNSPWIIAKGTLKRKVVWEQHSQWLNNLISDSHSHMYIIERDNLPIGQVRFMGAEDIKYLEISIYLTQDNIGKGYGVEALRIACNDISTKVAKRSVIGYVLRNNFQSGKAFEKAGFKKLDESNTDRLGQFSMPEHDIYHLDI